MRLWTATRSSVDCYRSAHTPIHKQAFMQHLRYYICRIELFRFALNRNNTARSTFEHFHCTTWSIKRKQSPSYRVPLCDGCASCWYDKQLGWLLCSHTMRPCDQSLMHTLWANVMLIERPYLKPMWCTLLRSRYRCLFCQSRTGCTGYAEYWWCDSVAGCTIRTESIAAGISYCLRRRRTRSRSTLPFEMWGNSAWPTATVATRTFVSVRKGCNSNSTQCKIVHCITHKMFWITERSISHRIW